MLQYYTFVVFLLLLTITMHCGMCVDNNVTNAVNVFSTPSYVSLQTKKSLFLYFLFSMHVKRHVIFFANVCMSDLLVDILVALITTTEFGLHARDTKGNTVDPLGILGELAGTISIVASAITS